MHGHVRFMPKESVLTSTEEWLLLEQNWGVTIIDNGSQTLNATSTTGAQLSAVGISVNQLPNVVSTTLRNDQIDPSNITETWAVNGGGFLLKVTVFGENKVYWFDTASHIKSIGKVI